MKWRKLGHLFVANNLSDKMLTHAANPTAIHLEDNRFRIFYSARDSMKRASIGYIDVNIDGENIDIIETPSEPALSYGEIGAFDDSGVSMGCILKIDNQYWMYYLGWNLGVTVPWRNSIGLAVSSDGKNFERVQLSPVLDRNKVDPFSVSYPWVIKEGDKWHMWYGSNLKWGEKQEDMAHCLKYATSKNGVDWQPTGEIAVSFKNDSEYAMSKPFVKKESGIFKMWYSYRGEAYRIGYAESDTGTLFERKDELVGIDVSDSGWDSETIEYPNIIDHKGKSYLLYNGNSYGLTGFGIAIEG